MVLAFLVRYLFTFQVMWLGSEGEIISQDDNVRSDDSRYSIQRPYLKEWNLQLKSVRRSDEGNFTCVISTTPPLKKYFYLKIVCKSTLLLLTT